MKRLGRICSAIWVLLHYRHFVCYGLRTTGGQIRVDGYTHGTYDELRAGRMQLSNEIGALALIEQTDRIIQEAREEYGPHDL